MGGDIEEFEVMKSMSYKPVGVDEGGEIQIGSINLQVVSGDIIQEKTNAIVNGTNRYLKHKGISTFWLRQNEPKGIMINRRRCQHSLATLLGTVLNFESKTSFRCGQYHLKICKLR